AFIYYETLGVKAVKPPPGLTNLIAFTEVMKTRELHSFTLQGRIHFVATVNPKDSILTVSVTPAYVFDENGFLMDWTCDTGDDPAFAERWGRFHAKKKTSTAEADAFLQSRSGKVSRTITKEEALAIARQQVSWGKDGIKNFDVGFQNGKWNVFLERDLNVVGAHAGVVISTNGRVLEFHGGR
ncbi:MAG: hypothetical protein JWM68_4243, partial [Verrucomicrobiales bacterium]|nr:hypothetical protein [Verrucomicrobiales bacterium]